MPKRKTQAKTQSNNVAKSSRKTSSKGTKWEVSSDNSSVNEVGPSTSASSSEVAKCTSQQKRGVQQCSSDVDKKVTLTAKKRKSHMPDTELKGTNAAKHSKMLIIPEVPKVDRNFTHCKLDWLKPDQISDARRRRPDDPDYDSSTLFVPRQFIRSQTPAHRQWWQLKASHFDCVLFFKVEKFYELYHMDAVIAVKELGLIYKKGDYAHCGFPEVAFPKMASTLVSRGYKVARVEQTETLEAMQKRCESSQNTNMDKEVRREICQITTLGTQVCGVMDLGPGEPNAIYMLAVVEEECKDLRTFGLCFIDTSIGLFHLGQFEDDKHLTRLLTTLAQHPPALIVYERRGLSARTMELLTTHCDSARMEARDLWTPNMTLKTLASKYFGSEENIDWPKGLEPFLYHDVLGLTPAPNSSLAIKALGGCVSYLTRCVLDVQILSMRQFTTYTPPDKLNKTLSVENEGSESWSGGSNMVLDATALKNLRLVQEEDCLYDKLDRCSTPFGKRLLYQWVCAPSCQLTVIKERQEAIKFLYEHDQLREQLKTTLSKLPDLERLLAKLHSFGNALLTKEHPDSRAIFYNKLYPKTKVLDFITILKGFSDALDIVDRLGSYEVALLIKLTRHPPKGKFPDYKEILKLFMDSFDHKQAKSEDRILPDAGFDEDYDSAIQQIEEIQDEIAEYLKTQERHFRCRVTYVQTERKRYQLEVPEKAITRAGPAYQLEGSRKGFKRFSTEETRNFLSRLLAAEEQNNVILKDITRRVFERFSSHYERWEGAVRCLACLDVLIALAEYAATETGPVCLPRITYDSQKLPYIKIKEGRHPCMPNVDVLIPNDTELGKGGNSVLILTGPNMSGKSTLLRQTGLLTVLAHMGSYVPAKLCELSLVDSVFTRLDAADEILYGQTTLNESSTLLSYVTKNTLVLIIDRGTSYDRTVIVGGICMYLERRKCRTIFATRQWTFIKQMISDSFLKATTIGHMACVSELNEEDVPENLSGEQPIPEEVLTFLYKLVPGPCPESYEFKAARRNGTRIISIFKNLARIRQELAKM